MSETISPLCDLTQLGFAEIDNDHREFVAIVEAIRQADSSEFGPLFLKLVEHTEAHFNRENQLMESSGFPALAEHRGEHHRVLGEARQMADRVRAGRMMMPKAYALEQLPGWFNLHIRTMDAATVRWLEQYNESRG